MSEDNEHNDSQSGNGGEPPWYESAGLPAEELTDSVKKYSSLAEFAKGYNNLNKIAGGIPGENASEEAKAAFYTKLGRPATADGYTWKAPEGVGIEEKAFGAFRAEAHKLGITDKQFSGILDKWGASVVELTKAREARLQQIEAESRAQLSAPNEWGDKYDAKLEATLKRIDELGVREPLEQAGLLYDARILKFVNAVVSSASESKQQGGAKQDTLARIEQLRKDPGYLNPGHPNHGELIRQLNELYESIQ